MQHAKLPANTNPLDPRYIHRYHLQIETQVSPIDFFSLMQLNPCLTDAFTKISWIVRLELPDFKARIVNRNSRWAGTGKDFTLPLKWLQFNIAG